MTLVLSNDDVAAVLTMDDCLDALETVFRDYEHGLAANRPRTHTYTPMGPDTHYMFKSMDGSWPRAGVHALRLSSDMVQEIVQDDVLKRIKQPVAPGGKWLGLVLLFSLETTELLAIIQDGYLQRMRVGATSGIAAKYLARPDARVAGMFGTGWQAGAQLLALARVRPDLELIKVYSPDRERRHAFAREWSERLPIPVRAVDDPTDVTAETQIVVGATNAMEPVIRGRDLAPGVHVNSVQGHEIDRDCLDRADIIVVRARDKPQFYAMGDRPPAEMTRQKHFSPAEQAKVATLGEVVAGRAGRRTPEQVSIFGGGGMGGSAGLGIQFAAVASRIVARARAAGVGQSIPTDWFLETMKP